MDQLHTANKVCGGCCAIALNTVDTESSVSPISLPLYKDVYSSYNENFLNIKNLVQHIMDFSHYRMHTIQHTSIIK